MITSRPCLPFQQDFIQHNYHESGTLYYKEIGELSEIRQACRTPVRTDAGIQLLFEYYNQLYFVERRFFAGATSPNLFMEWYVLCLPPSEGAWRFSFGVLAVCTKEQFFFGFLGERLVFCVAGMTRSQASRLARIQ